MRNELDAALKGEPWCVAGLLFGLDHILDESGRPLAERRAPSRIKDGVPMELVACPYDDERRGSFMNQSALEQITGYLKPVYASIDGFVAALGPGEPSWERVYLTVIDLLAAPSLELLTRRDPHAPISEVKAVGYKLAAGYFAVLRQLCLEESLGNAVPVDVDAFLDFVHQRRALMGGREVCAGPANLIRRTTRVLLHGTVGGDACGALRPQVAEKLLQQVLLGVRWELADRQAERRFLDFARVCLKPKNSFITTRFEDRCGELDGLSPVDSPHLQSGWSTEERQAAQQELERLCRLGEGAFEVRPGDVEWVAREMSARLGELSFITAALWQLEQQLRELLAQPLDVDVRLGGLILPRSRTLSWFEAVLGHTFECVPSHRPSMRAKNLRRDAPVPPSLATHQARLGQDAL